MTGRSRLYDRGGAESENRYKSYKLTSHYETFNVEIVIFYSICMHLTERI